MQRSASARDTFYDLAPVPAPPEGASLPEAMARDFFLHLDSMGKRPGLDSTTMGEGLANFVTTWHNTGPARRAVRMETHVISPQDRALLAQDPVNDAVVSDLHFFQNTLSAVASGFYYLTSALAPALATNPLAYDTARHVWAAMFELHGMMQLRMKQRLALALFGTPPDALPACAWPTPFKQVPMIPLRERKELRTTPRPAQQRHRRRGNGNGAATTATHPTPQAQEYTSTGSKGFPSGGSKSGSGHSRSGGARGKHK